MSYLTDESAGSSLDLPGEGFREPDTQVAESGQPDAEAEGVAPAEATPTADEPKVETSDPTTPATTTPPAPVKWDSPDNPFFEKATRGEQLETELRAVLAEQRTRQQVESWREQLEGVIDADEAQVPTIVNGVIEQVATHVATPLLENNQSLARELEASYHGMSAMVLAAQRKLGETGWKEVTDQAAQLRNQFTTYEDMETFLNSPQSKVGAAELDDTKSKLAIAQAEIERLKAGSNPAYRSGGTPADAGNEDFDPSDWGSLLQGL